MRTKALVFVCLFLPIIQSSSSRAQNAFFGPYESGLFLGASYSSIEFDSSEDLEGFGAGFAHSFSGLITLGLSYSRITPDTDLDLKPYVDQPKETAFTPYVAALVLRPGNGSILGIEVSASYSHATLSGGDLDADAGHFRSDQKLNKDTYAISTDFFLEVPLTSEVKFFPTLSFTYVGDGMGTDNEFTYDPVSDGLISIAATLQIYKKLVVIPSVSIEDDFTAYSISINVVAPRQPHR